MARILLTGFAPFNNETTNPSWQAVRQFEGKLSNNGSPIFVAELPCEFHRATEELVSLIERHQCDIVLCVGQAGGRAEISLERVAINMDDARIPDNRGQQPIDRPIEAHGQAAYFSTLPIKAIVHCLRQSGIPAHVSNTAGTYVCNHLFYGLMHYAARNEQIWRAGFIHIPYLPEQAIAHPGAPSMSLDTLVSALDKAIETCLEQGQDLHFADGTLS
ncbi:pyroglutamyl-peptidase I [Undibacterium cyanobacteriorum]|uniref:Pyrrolidone-carboxylate peptidase n=1 Tax=Undibacterium cyanobacteriorum TaxID=3073561 RepID=A0ABY9RI43_9BURK|nr:pyroglutamyl-peptidase I [Undibacterium sp. 20NA77.5]WMW79992.1 pyroglutamyl-peptidase I [Undibacterium sp. 20NA77.5]